MHRHHEYAELHAADSILGPMAEALVRARLAFQEGTPYSEDYGDVYHSAAGGAAQAEHVFLKGNDLPGRWAGRPRFVILETGFGLGLNFLDTWRAWKRDPARCARLHYVAIEKHPFSREDLQVLHERLGFEEAAELHSHWPVLVPGAHRLELDGGKVVLTLFLADVAIARDLRLQADAFYLDGFAPAKNPEMWTPQLLRSLSRLAAPGATAATWSVARSVRTALEATGFAVEKRPGFGHKKEMLVARLVREGATPAPPERRAAVVGAGIAGAAVCERLCARGWEVELYERHAEPAQEASGNHAGTFHPIVTPDDSVFARLTRAAFLYSIEKFKKLNVRWDPCGVLQLARDAKEESSQRSALGLPPEYAQYVRREEASAHAGVPVAAPGLWFPQAGWIQPRSLVDALLGECGTRLRVHFGRELSKLPNGTVILANSAEAPKLVAVPHLRLRKVRGQATYVRAEDIDAPHVVVLRGGMVLPPVDGLCVIGASYDIDDEDAAPRAESDAGNIERLMGILATTKPTPVGNRVAFRSVTPDRLPVAGEISPGVYGAFAYGSRGLIWAALAAEVIASRLEGEPLPLEGKLADAMDPLRFSRRARSRGSLPSRRAGRTAPA
jgi:tRNA 5-methylaminomethyl-2-thiouridine biosynthesis bifunctional protein